MNYIPPKEILREINKYPMAYVLLIMAGLIGAFVTWAIDNNKEKDAYNKRMLEECLKDSRKKDSLLIAEKDNAIRHLMKNDSTNRAILDKPAKKLLEEIKK
jgi:hypothetical protein